MDNSLNQITYDQLKKDILSFTLKPGESVSAAKIADRYSVSRTPARESLVKLETEGLVNIIPQSKSIISRIDINKAKQEWFVRNSLEMSMVNDLFDNVTSKNIEDMKHYNHIMEELSNKEYSIDNIYEYQLADSEFHMVTYKAANQILASNIIRNFNAHYSRLRFLTELNRMYQVRTINGHGELISCIENRDINGYKKALEIHLGHVINDIDYLKEMFPLYFEEE